METFTIIFTGIIGIILFISMPIIAIIIVLRVLHKIAKKKIDFIQKKQKTQEEILEELKKQNQRL